MNIDNFNWKKSTFYMFLFFLTATLTAALYAIIILFTSFFLWLVVPSSLIYCATILITIGLFLFLLFIARRKHKPWLTAISLGGSSIPVLMLILIIFSTFSRANQNSNQEPNQRQPLTSPSGKYVLTVPIEHSKESRGRLGFGLPYWRVTISDLNGNVLHCDMEDDYPGWFGAYWAWDKEDRVWLFSYDTGTVFFERIDGNWTKFKYSKGSYAEKNIEPPKSLYPNHPNLEEI